jgi:hypothetical protein
MTDITNSHHESDRLIRFNISNIGMLVLLICGLGLLGCSDNSMNKDVDEADGTKGGDKIQAAGGALGEEVNACFEDFQNCLDEGTNDSAECETALNECIDALPVDVINLGDVPVPEYAEEINACFEDFQNCLDEGTNDSAECETALNECIDALPIDVLTTGDEDEPVPEEFEGVVACGEEYQKCLDKGTNDSADCEAAMNECIDALPIDVLSQ